MAVDEDRIESDLNNMEIAYEKAQEALQKYLKEELATPALTAVVETNFAVLMKNAPALRLISQVDSSTATEIGVALVLTFLIGVEWGKQGRDLYSLPAHEACDDPTHSHHISKRN